MSGEVTLLHPMCRAGGLSQRWTSNKLEFRMWSLRADTLFPIRNGQRDSPGVLGIDLDTGNITGQAILVAERKGHYRTPIRQTAGASPGRSTPPSLAADRCS